MEDLVRGFHSGGLEQPLAEHAWCRSRAFFFAEGFAKGFTCDPEGASFIAEDVAPASGPHGLGSAAAECDGAGSGDRDDTVFSAEGAGKRDEGVVRDQPAFGGYCFAKKRLFVLRTAAHAKAGGLENDVGGKAGVGDCRADALADSA